MIKGDVILVPFPFTDLTGLKNRPALVLLATEYDITVAFISTQIKGASSLDLLIHPNIENGLKRESLIRVSKIVTLDKKIVLGRLGRISDNDIKSIDSKLIQAFSIKT
ncbi:type II toxin-antitoxin system PemK/MazF family toxin [Algoriphagus sp. D3-2-R+10]|uniref:type II toxin-antitoxin system PemK/MazF family toxin n=1 Tax=Algoriphagus aurantiacus TaxID=3103948 RepID=UPI002B37EC1E|nr:type II toxin-antitoxin system PemK/MazF family toxin [Algoriphagus sp. D3-2-R+10]MEB2775552.1 type II toxin-antitoxin system PemK/MazF family toxin [Algoriphagus sp. D3-2-R+10]